MTLPMDELSHVLRVKKYFRRKHQEDRERLHRLQTACEIQVRLIKNHRRLTTALAECIRNGNKNNFRLLFDSYKDLREATQSLQNGKDAGSIPCLDAQDTNSTAQPNFLRSVDDSVRNHVIHFVLNIIYRGPWLIDKLMSLDAAQLKHMVDTHDSLDPGQSVFDSRSTTVKRQTSSIYSGNKVSNYARQVLDVSRHDSVLLLLDLVGYHHHGRDTACRIQLETWSGICYQMLSNPNSQRHRFVVAVIDNLAIDRLYLGRRALETWLMEILQEGMPLLEDQSRSTFRARVEMSKDEQRTGVTALEIFLDSAVGRLLDLLSSTPDNGIIPYRAILLSRNIIFKAGANSSRALQLSFFMISKWLFETFLHQHIVFPEVENIHAIVERMLIMCRAVTCYSITTSQNTRVAVSYEKSLVEHHKQLQASFRIGEKLSMPNLQVDGLIIVGYRKHTSSPKSPARSNIKKIVSFFRPSEADSDLNAVSGKQWCTTEVHNMKARSLCAADVFTMVETLYPLNQDQSDTSSDNVSRQGHDRHHASAEKAREAIRRNLETFSVAGSNHTTKVDRSVASTPTDVHPIWPAASESGYDMLLMSKHDEALGLRNACLQMIQLTGHPNTAGICSPVVEDWALLEMGEEELRFLSTQSRPTYLDHQLETEIGPDKSDDESDAVSPISQSYFTVKKAVFDLIERFSAAELPLVDDGFDKDAWQTRPSGTATEHATNPFRAPAYRVGSPSNPFRSRNQNNASMTATPVTNLLQEHPLNSASSPLLTFLEKTIKSLEHDEDYDEALKHESVYQQVNRIINTQFPLVKHLIRDAQRELDRVKKWSDTVSKTAAILESQLQAQHGVLVMIDGTVESIRIKMWYCTDVQSSARHEELSKIASALKMIGPPRNPLPVKSSQPPLRRKTTMLHRDPDLKSRSVSTIMDILSTDPSFCIDGKLADEQVDVVLKWMEQDGIDNICRGEERLHRLLYELSRSVSQLVGPDATNNPVLWSSELFHRDRVDGENEALRNELSSSDERSTSPTTRPGSSNSEASLLDRYSVDYRRKSFFNPRPTTPQLHQSSADYFVNRSPTTTIGSSLGLRSPSISIPHTSPSFTSIPTRTWSPQNLRQSLSRDSFKSATSVKSLLNNLSLIVTELLVSEFLPQTFHNGAETDQTTWQSHGGFFAKRASMAFDSQKREESVARNQNVGAKPRSTNDQPKTGNHSGQSRPQLRTADQSGHNVQHDSTRLQTGSSNLLDSDTACKKLLHRFELAPSPYTKLKALHDLQRLLLALDPPLLSKIHLPDNSDAARDERSEQTSTPGPRRSKYTNRERSIKRFIVLFESSSTRPANLFLHLQTIASLIPATILGTDARAAAFTHAVIAATTVKNSICKLMMETADRILAKHTSQRPTITTRSSVNFCDPTSPSIQLPITDTEISSFTMATAANFLTTTAKGGFPAAQRELATLYLTYPDILSRTIMPLSKTGDAVSYTHLTLPTIYSV